MQAALDAAGSGGLRPDPGYARRARGYPVPVYREDLATVARGYPARDAARESIERIERLGAGSFTRWARDAGDNGDRCPWLAGGGRASRLRSQTETDGGCGGCLRTRVMERLRQQKDAWKGRGSDCQGIC